MNKEKQRVYFLDIDGVISSARIGWYCFDKYAVAYINKLCEVTKGKVVISSTWRRLKTKEWFSKYFPLHEDWKTKNIYKNIEVGRGDEINEWMGRHPEIDDYLIFDDDRDFTKEQIEDKLICTNSLNGLMIEDMMKVNDLLGIKIYGRLFNETEDLEDKNL